ncbi:MAG: hypothetical protein ACRDK5_11550 [Solirubrobacterales bacterium]
MSSRLSDPQRLVELVADQMFREGMRSRNGRGPAIHNGGPVQDGQPAHGAEAAGEQRSPCDPPD